MMFNVRLTGTDRTDRTCFNVLLLAVVEHQVVAEVEEEGDEASGGDYGEDEEATDVGRPDWLSLDFWAKLVAQITLAAPLSKAPNVSQIKSDRFDS